MRINNTIIVLNKTTITYCYQEMKVDVSIDYTPSSKRLISYLNEDLIGRSFNKPMTCARKYTNTKRKFFFPDLKEWWHYNIYGGNISGIQGDVNIVYKTNATSNLDVNNYLTKFKPSEYNHTVKKLCKKNFTQ
jgi:hypothetical protein